MYNKKYSGADIARVVKDAFSNALEREGIYASMEEGRFSPLQMDYFKITMEDFEKAIGDYLTFEFSMIMQNREYLFGENNQNE